MVRQTWSLAPLAVRGLVDVVLPHRCAVCGMPLGHERGLCAPCWSRIDFVSPPFCRACGVPLPGSVAMAPLCGACTAAAPLVRRTRAALLYDDASRRLTIAFKHYGRLSLRPLLVQWLRRAAAELLDDADVVVPVPLHRWRLLHRGYNQSVLLARGLVADEPSRFVPDLLVRHRSTKPQQGLGNAERRSNVTAAAFRVRPAARSRLEGAQVLLVDDVLTTGATRDACARVLLREGAAAVDAVCLARVT